MKRQLPFTEADMEELQVCHHQQEILAVYLAIFGLILTFNMCCHTLFTINELTIKINGVLQNRNDGNSLSLSLSPFPVKDSGGWEFTWGSLLPKSHEDFLICWQVPSDHKIWNWLYCISLQKEIKHLRFILSCKLVMQCKDNPYMLSTDLQWLNSCYQPICQIGYAFCQQGTLILCFGISSFSLFNMTCILYVLSSNINDC